MVNRDKYGRVSKKNLLERLSEEGESDKQNLGRVSTGEKNVKAGEFEGMVGGAAETYLFSRNDARMNDHGKDGAGVTKVSRESEEGARAIGSRIAIRFLSVSALIIVVSFVLYQFWLKYHREYSYVGPIKNPQSVYSVEYIQKKPDFIRCNCSDDNTLEIDARSYLAVSADSFETIAGKDPDVRVPFASISKLLGILVALDFYDLEEEIGLLEAVDTYGNGVGLEVGETLKVEQLVATVVVGSRNDAMYALAQNYSGGEEGFVHAMNKKAQALGLHDTSIQNVIGLDDGEQYSTPRDIAVLSIVAMRNPVVSEYASQMAVEILSDKGRSEVIYSTNELLGEVDGVVGLKTGYTESAGLCLVTYVKDNPDFVTVVLNAGDRFEETRLLIEWVRRNRVCR